MTKPLYLTMGLSALEILFAIGCDKSSDRGVDNSGDSASDTESEVGSDTDSDTDTDSDADTDTDTDSDTDSDEPETDTTTDLDTAETVETDINDGLSRLTECYSPCNRGIVVDGTYLPCSEEGLIQACFGNTACVNGWCVASADKPSARYAPSTGSVVEKSIAKASATGACESECDCPEHGACLDGLCGGTCDEAEGIDCPEGAVCVKHVCRIPCSGESLAFATTGADCEQGYFCETGEDGVTGYCMPECKTGHDAPEENTCLLSARDLNNPAFSISGDGLTTNMLMFNSMRTKGEFTLTNNTMCALTFTVAPSTQTSYLSTGSAVVTENPLAWISISAGDTVASDSDSLSISLEQGASVTIAVSDAFNSVISNWFGKLEVKNLENLGALEVQLSYTSGVTGTWTGKMFSFANFGDNQLAAWIADPNNSTLLNSVDNAFIKRWDVMRRGEISLDNFMAMLSSTQTGSWNWASIKEACSELKPAGACYPFANVDEGNKDDGIEGFSDDLAKDPVPSGLVELPLTINIEKDEEDSSKITGRIVSSETLHYAGNPAVTMAVEEDADTCTRTGSFNTCLNRVVALNADILVGGRYKPGSDNLSCNEAESFVRTKIPWLLPDFKGGTDTPGSDGLRYMGECRDFLQPYTAESLGDPSVKPSDINANMAGSNPIPDGRTIQRNLSLVDGAFIDYDTLFVIFKETFSVDMAPNPDPEDFSGYGFMILKRSAAGTEDTNFEGADQKETRIQPQELLTPTCDPDLKEQSGFSDADAASKAELAAYVVTGRNSAATVESVTETVHYLCWETGLFDRGTDGNAPCPLGSPVSYFYFPNNEKLNDAGTVVTVTDLKNESCQQNAVINSTQIDSAHNDASVVMSARGSCDQTFAAWKATGAVVVDPAVGCDTSSVCANKCDQAMSRTACKLFQKAAADAYALPISDVDSAVDDAFRYKTAFRTRAGKNIGFAPSMCEENSTSVPYCYGPNAVEEIEKRMDCAAALYQDPDLAEDTDSLEMLRTYLKKSFSSRCVDDTLGAEACRRGENRIDGFEALNAELLIMLGDESYTKAFASRFDLAAVSQTAFEGSLFEPGGINLTGVAGYEMFSLYQAGQYYQTALDRFYSLMGGVTASLSEGDKGYITAETVTSYLDRLIRASTQKSRTYSEIAKRYQGFNRPDLARRVIQRAYTSTYLESLLITRMMRNIIEVVPPENEAQIRIIIENAQLRYKAALLDMRDVNDTITNDLTVFGFAPDYIPFPALDDGDINAFEKQLAQAQSKTDIAAEKESIALESNRDFDVNAASFQSELADIRNNYEGQLSEICGTFEGDDGAVYPAIPEYAEMNEGIRRMQDPCGLVGNGTISDGLYALQDAQLSLDSAIQARKNIVDAINIEADRVAKECTAIGVLAATTIATQVGQNTLQFVIDSGDLVIKSLEGGKDTITEVTAMAKCTPPSGGTTVSVGDCPAGAAAAAAMTASNTSIDGAILLIGAAQNVAKQAIAAGDILKTGYQFGFDCAMAKVNSQAVINEKALELSTADLEIYKQAYALKAALSNLEGLFNQAKSTRAEYEEAKTLAVDVTAAMNDPNTRIYKNDAIITADRTFNEALKEAYKATKIYEYYTSQSYAHLVDLFLVRMVSAGDYNLEGYLQELEAAYTEFEETHGNPDTRMAVYSLKDDILNIPQYSDETFGSALSQSERNSLFFDAVKAGLNSETGTYDFKFNTRLSDVSPMTRNHKLLYVEAEMVGEDLGDTVGRIYLSQSGTGTIYGLDNEYQYFRFPERLAVVNTFFNNDRAIPDSEVYISRYLRDRPLACSEWNLIFDPFGEEANQDIPVENLTDIKLYLYYRDFSVL